MHLVNKYDEDEDAEWWGDEWDTGVKNKKGAHRSHRSGFKYQKQKANREARALEPWRQQQSTVAVPPPPWRVAADSLERSFSKFTEERRRDRELERQERGKDSEVLRDILADLRSKRDENKRMMSELKDFYMQRGTASTRTRRSGSPRRVQRKDRATSSTAPYVEEQVVESSSTDRDNDEEEDDSSEEEEEDMQPKKSDEKPVQRKLAATAALKTLPPKASAPAPPPPHSMDDNKERKRIKSRRKVKKERHDDDEEQEQPERDTKRKKEFPQVRLAKPNLYSHDVTQADGWPEWDFKNNVYVAGVKQREDSGRNAFREGWASAHKDDIFIFDKLDENEPELTFKGVYASTPQF